MKINVLEYGGNDSIWMWHYLHNGLAIGGVLININFCNFLICQKCHMNDGAVWQLFIESVTRNSPVLTNNIFSNHCTKLKVSTIPLLRYILHYHYGAGHICILENNSHLFLANCCPPKCITHKCTIGSNVCPIVWTKLMFHFFAVSPLLSPPTFG